MPIKNIFPDDKIGLYRIGTEVLTANEVLQANNEVLAQEKIQGKLLYCIVDLTQCTSFEASQNDLRKIAESDSRILDASNNIVIGIAASEDLIFGLVRSWQGYSDIHDFHHYVDRDLLEVETWVKDKVKEVHGVDIKICWK